MTRLRRTALSVAVGAAIAAAAGGGWLAGRSTLPSCTGLRDAHRAAALEIAARAQVDPATIEPEPVARSYALVERRPDCFSSFEQQEARNLYRLHGPESHRSPASPGQPDSS